MPTTEVVTIPLVEGSDIGNPDNHAAAAHKDSAVTVSQQDGFQTLSFGLGLENPETLQWMITWDSRQKHEEFMETPAYQPFLKKFGSIIGGPFSIVHVDFSPPGGLERALSAPVTEVATFYFDEGPPSDAFSSMEKFVKAWEAEAGEGKVRWAYGTTHEEIEKDGVKGKGTVLLIGWESKEEHMQFRETEVFKTHAASLIRQNSKTAEVHHTQFMKFVE